MNDLDAVLKYLKNNKSRDPLGNINELFKPSVAGDDLKHGILLKIKESNEFSEAFKRCNITSIFKKGKRNDFNNYQGVFRVMVFRSILNRFIYNDIYPVVGQ